MQDWPNSKSTMIHQWWPILLLQTLNLRHRIWSEHPNSGSRSQSKVRSSLTRSNPIFQGHFKVTRCLRIPAGCQWGPDWPRPQHSPSSGWVCSDDASYEGGLGPRGQWTCVCCSGSFGWHDSDGACADSWQSHAALWWCYLPLGWSWPWCLCCSTTWTGTTWRTWLRRAVCKEGSGSWSIDAKAMSKLMLSLKYFLWNKLRLYSLFFE